MLPKLQDKVQKDISLRSRAGNPSPHAHIISRRARVSAVRSCGRGFPGDAEGVFLVYNLLEQIGAPWSCPKQPNRSTRSRWNRLG